MPKNNFTKQNDLNETGAHFLFASVTTLTTNPAYIPGSLCFIEMIRHQTRLQNISTDSY